MTKTTSFVSKNIHFVTFSGIFDPKRGKWLMTIDFLLNLLS